MYNYTNLLHGVGGELSEELTATLLCDKLGWTYDEFLDTPVWFVKALLGKIQADNQYAERQSKKK